MGMFVNRVELIGNLGRDPEIRSTQTGKKIATLSIATSESWKDQQSGEWKERTEWHRVVIFNEGLAKVAEKHLTSGMKVRIEGKLRTRKWQDQVRPGSLQHGDPHRELRRLAELRHEAGRGSGVRQCWPRAHSGAGIGWCGG